MNTYFVHPAFGMSTKKRYSFGTTQGALLPLSWLRLRRSRRRCLEERFFGTLLRYLADRKPEAIVEGSFHSTDAAAYFAAGVGAEIHKKDFSVRLTNSAIEALIRSSTVEFIVSLRAEEIFRVDSGWLGARVNISGEEARELETLLERAIDSEDATSGGVLRALVYRATYFVFAALCILSGVVVGEIASGGALRYLIGVVTMLFAIGVSIPLTRALERRW